MEKISPRKKLETWLSEKYSIRYNTIKYTVEFAKYKKGKDKSLEYSSLTDRDMFTMLREIDDQTELKVNERLLFQVLNSNYAELYNPITDYFDNLSFKQDEIKRSEIDYLSEFVILKNPNQRESFKKVLRSWLISSVANSLTPTGCQNQTCLVFTGTQGKGKTTFLNSLCPPALLDYLYTSNLDLKSKDTFIMLGQNFIINIDDQLENLFKQDAETLKTLITQREKKIRLPHGRFVQNVPRIANFLGSLNHNEFLKDQSGNRRFLPFEVSGFVIPEGKHSYDIDKVWFEAYNEFKSCIKENKPYWLTKEQLEDMFGGFEEFFVATPEEEAIKALFEVPTEPKHLNSQFKKLMAIEVEKIILDAKITTRINLKTIGTILKKLNCLQVTRSGGKRCFWLRPKDAIERENEQNFDAITDNQF